MSVIVVTDSSSRLQPDELKEFDIRQVPLHVLVDGTDLRDGVDDVPYEIHDRARVTTAGATPAELAETYQQALSDSGGDGVVAVHLSAALSSTYSSAVQTAREFGSAVRVVNSRSAAMGVGFIALAAAGSASSGADLDSVEAVAQRPYPQGGVVAGHRAVAQAPTTSRRRRPFSARSTDPHRQQGACGVGRAGRRSHRGASGRDRGTSCGQPRRRR